MNSILKATVETFIYVIRNQKVMLDYDLAALYGVETKVLNQAVRRHLERFPADFMFQLTEIEAKNLRSQFVTSSLRYGGRRHRPFAFTELGIAMLSSVLKSEAAIQVNISIMRSFFRMRKVLKESESLSEKVKQLEQNTNQIFKVVFERLDDLEGVVPAHPPRRRKIGFVSE